jgi:hypothetical protein
MAKFEYELDSYRSHFTRLASQYMTMTTIICSSNQSSGGGARNPQLTLLLRQTTRQTVPKS